MSDERATDLPADAPWWAKYLVANAGNWWRWASTWILAAAVAAPEAYEALPQLQQYVPPAVFHHLEAVLAILAFIGRLAKQPPKGPT